MSVWKKYRLADVVSLVIDHRGKTPKKLGGDWAETGYRALSAKSVKTRQIVNEDAIRCVDEEMYRRWMKDEIQRGDILVTSEAPYGEVYYWNSDEKIVLSQRLFGLRVKPEFDSAFIAHYMTSQVFKSEMDGRATGTTVFGLRQPELLDCKLLVPDLPTQRRIAVVLGALDDKIEVNRKICENLEAQAQALFKAWFVDFEPFGGKRPEGWKMGKLGDVADCNQRSYSAKEAWPEVSYLDTGSITKNVIAEVQLLSMDKAPSRARRKVRQYSIVYSTVRPNLCHYGIIADVKENMLVSTGFAVVDAKECCSPFHAYLALTSEDVTKKLHALAEQSVCTYPALNPEDVMAVDILIPTLDIEKRFDNLVRPMFDLVEKKSQESRILAAMRDALLPKLMSGELAVEKVEVGACASDAGQGTGWI